MIQVVLLLKESSIGLKQLIYHPFSRLEHGIHVGSHQNSPRPVSRKPTGDGLKISMRFPLPNPRQIEIGTSHKVQLYHAMNMITGSKDVM
jgi:hypothetical protein